MFAGSSSRFDLRIAASSEVEAMPNNSFAKLGRGDKGKVVSCHLTAKLWSRVLAPGNRRTEANSFSAANGVGGQRGYHFPHELRVHVFRFRNFKSIFYLEAIKAARVSTFESTCAVAFHLWANVPCVSASTIGS